MNEDYIYCGHPCEAFLRDGTCRCVYVMAAMEARSFGIESRPDPATDADADTDTEATEDE